MKKVRPTHAIICEDIRTEKSNKYIFVGVFPGAIQVESFPLTIPLAFYIGMAGLKPGRPTEYTVRLSGPGEGEAVMNVRIQCFDPDGIGAIASPAMQINCTGPGELKLEAGPNEDSLQTVLTKRVLLQSSASPTASPPPDEQSPPDAPES